MVESAIVGTMDRDNKLRQGQGSCRVNATIPLALYLLRPIAVPIIPVEGFLSKREIIE